MRAHHPTVLLVASLFLPVAIFSATGSDGILVSDARLAELESNSVDRPADDLLELALAYDERRDTTQAAELYRQAASHGIGAAELRLGFLHEIGSGVTQSYPEARAHYERAITLGVPEAHLRLGMLYLEGWGMPADTVAALAHIERAAEAGYTPAQKILSDMFFAGVKVERNLAKALQWAERAAVTRDPASQVRVGAIHQKAIKLPQDIQLAREWYQLSAEQDYTRGMLAMAGTFFRRGADPATLEIGLRWLDLAAEGGNAAAAFYRAGIYLRRGPQNTSAEELTKARNLIEQAAKAGEFAAVEVLELEKAGQPLPLAFAYVMNVPFEDRYVQRLQHEVSDDPPGKQRPRPLKIVRPVYPTALRLTGTEGEVDVEFVVDTTGRVRDAHAIRSTHPGFGEIAAESVRSWRFLPAMVDGRPVNTRMRVPVRFRMSEILDRRPPSPSSAEQTSANPQ